MVLMVLMSACSKPSDSSSLAAVPSFKETTYIGECKGYNGSYGNLSFVFKGGKFSWLAPIYSDDKCTIETINIIRDYYDYSIVKQNGSRFLVKSEFFERTNYFVIEIDSNTDSAKILLTDKEAEANDAFDKPITTRFSNYIYHNTVEL